jgi:prepilin-type N-terminal cleavage/methylation domain-containing protein
MNHCANIKFEAEQGNPAARGFTLLELLIVIVIIGVLATIGLPAIKGITKSNATTAATRQMLDDLAYARRLAIADHTTVYMVFIPPGIDSSLFPNAMNNFTAATDRSVLSAYTNVFTGQYNTYALIALRSVGDQPGVSTPHYLTPWRTLPNGTFISTNKFTNYDGTVASDYNRAFPQNFNSGGPSFPFPLISSNATALVGLPYIGFNYLGQLTSTNFEGEAIPLIHGSVFYPGLPTGDFTPDIVLTPPPSVIATNNTDTNVIHVDWLTGKARLERQEVQ